MESRKMYPPQKNSPSTFLMGDITATDTFIVVGNSDVLPQEVPYPLTLGIDKTITETVLVTAIGEGNNQLTVERGDGALAWLNGTKCARVFTAKDLKDLQDNVTDVVAQSNTNKDAIGDENSGLVKQVADLENTVGDEDSGLVKGLADEVTARTQGIQNESQRAQAAEGQLNTNKINRSEMPQVIVDWVYTADGTGVTLTITRYNASNQTTTTFQKTIPMVSNEDAGLMTPEAYSEITSLRSDVSALQQQGGHFIGVSFATKSDLDNYTIPEGLHIGDFTYVLDDETQQDATTRYVYDGVSFKFAYVINYDPIEIATADTAGIVKSDGGTTEGKVFVEVDGTMSVIGWGRLWEELGKKYEFPEGGTADQFLNGLGEWAEPAVSSGVFVLRATFEDGIATGSLFTAIGGSLNYSGTVPASHVVDIPANDPNTTYTIQCGNSKSTVDVANLYGIFPVTVMGAPTNVTCTPLNGNYGQAATAQASCNSSLTVKWSATDLPTGFSINQTTGAITGSSTAVGTGNFKVTATSDAGATVSGNIAYKISALKPSNIVGADLIAEDEGEYVSVQFTVNKNGAAVTWGVDGLPDWADILNTYDSADLAICEIGGYPRAGDEGSGTFLVQATNSAGYVQLTKNWSVSYYVLFGFNLTLATADPSARVTYPSGVANYGWTPAKMNFGGVFNYGSWVNNPWFMPKPCMLRSNGTVAYYLNPNDYTKKADGTASDVANTSFDGNAMMEWPKIYVSRKEVSGVYQFRICNKKWDSSFECWSNYDINNYEIDHFYTPIYNGSGSTSKLRSLSGQACLVSTTAQQEIDAAKANGANIWYTEVLSDRMLLIDLCILLSKSTDSQGAFGQGRVNSSSQQATGSMNTKGLFWGGNPDETGVKVFGMEHPWGNILRRTAGYMLVSSDQKIKLTRGTKDGSTVSDYNITAAGYLSLGSYSGSSGGYISATKTHVGGRFLTTASGSATTYECDAVWSNTATYYALFGGYWSDALLAGVSCVLLSGAPSGAYSNRGAALSCKPLA